MQLLSLQVLRAIAAVAVVICHAGFQLNYWTKTTIEWNNIGTAGVDLFFVISGFIITLASWNSFGRIDQVAPFIARRFIRIGFLYWLLTTIYVLSNSYPLSRVAASYLFLPVDGSHVIPVAWTLVYEVMFYLIVAACLVLPRTFGLGAVVAVLIGLTLSHNPFYGHPMILEFALGIGAAIAYRNGVRLPTAVCLALIAAGFATFMATGTYAAHYYAEHSVVRWGIPAAMILTGAVLAPELPSNRFWRSFALIGDASYALYLTHMPVNRFAGNMARLTGLDFAASPFAMAAYFVISVALVICVAIVVFKIVEEPVLEASKRLLRRPIAVPAT